ncbi:RNA polymerase sigma-70 factor, ECF subfamily [Actinopolymorpha cephalotaxi]|uniref:RNA polymerase sigma-70 factor (ECF subfamily) n=1 Tax=Actinopolymorpha cephalotaxi TaxID=504797 RepID=A0A1I2N346_9ACTN|nr:RNA polymerase sigma factor [Actinopolymorpha cephalotaxi]NYH85736.1 RNA polymerase sigma-70 factor (ECF subfamily) [Actinopolymorpha cephalotaxi]SFF97530.1 RNA polymerase sigma-70 factor, ECF subfamily [Actinopolymorpha cephalotaxi]
MSLDTHALSPPLERALYTNVDDNSLIRVSVEQPEAFGELFERHARELHRFLSRRLGDLADDLLGELFVTAFERRASYRAELADARPWLYGIAANLVRRHHRAEAARYRALARVPLAIVTADSSPEAMAAADAAAVRPRLAMALGALKPADREVLLMLAWGQLDQAEVAAALGIPVGTVRSRLHRARQQLRPVLSDLQGELR